MKNKKTKERELQRTDEKKNTEKNVYIVALIQYPCLLDDFFHESSNNTIEWCVI